MSAVYVDPSIISKPIKYSSNPEKRNRVLNLLSVTREYIVLTDEIISRVRIFCEAGLRTYDALHLACAESVNAIFITSDDKINRTIQNNPNLTTTSVKNPVLWIMEEHHV
jgi:predicted nucleic acid-binding protein